MLENLSHTEENYLKAIFSLSKKTKGSVSTNHIADKLTTKPSSVTDMIKKLADKLLVDYKKYQGVSLTQKGRKTAVSIVRNHRLWEVFLVDKLDFKWDEVHDLAEQLEHIKSEQLTERLDAFLDFPTHDPHGDPIPDKNGNIEQRKSEPLSNSEIGKQYVIARVDDSSDNLLKYLDKKGIAIGKILTVIHKEIFDNSLEINIDDKHILITEEVAKNLLVRINNNIMNKKITLILLTVIAMISCKNEPKKENGKLNIVTTTTMITDLVTNIGGNVLNIQGLMGSGVDPHLYKASEGDVSKIANADIIFYGGLHLEGKLVEVFEKMKHQNINTIAVSDTLDQKTLIGSELFKGNYDPHIWFNIDYWQQITQFVVTKLSEALPEQKATFEANGKNYIAQLEVLKIKLKSIIETLPQDKRVLVTAHDAFSYFGKAYGFEVVGLQGLSTATEAGVQDVQKLAAFIIDKNVKAIFVESSVPKRTIEALQAAVNSKGHQVEIGGTLYSDALGNAGTVEGTYIGMFEYNVNTIVNALK